MNMAPLKVLIVGSGLAGCLLANGLMRSKIDVAVYERLARDANREGYQIRLGSSALMGMRACLSEEDFGKVIAKFGRSSGHFASAPILYDKDFNIVLNANRLPAYDKSAPINRKILREILAAPIDRAGKLFYEKAFDRYEILHVGTDEEKVRVWFKDGSFNDGDVLIAADGSHSSINKQVGLDNLKTVTSHWAFLSKCDLHTTSFEKMSKKLLEAPVAVSSDERSLYFCAYMPDQGIPSDPSTTVVANQFSEVADSLSSCFFGYCVPARDVPDNLQDLSLSEKWMFLKNEFATNWSLKFGEIIDVLQGSDLYVYQARVSTPRPVNWRSKIRSSQTPEKGHSRVLLIGDAVHAMLPNRGMGGNQAMRDAAVLLPLLIELNDKKYTERGASTDDVDVVCASFEKEMMPRAFGWVRKSGGDTWMVADTATWTGRAFMTAAGIFLDIVYAFYWVSSFVYRHALVDDAPELRG